MAAWTNNENGKAFYRAGRYAEARDEFRRAAADSPRNADYVHNYATASRRAGDSAAAEQAYRTALSLDPSHQPSYHGLAVTLKDAGRAGEAHSLLSSWVASQPYSERAYIEMAWLQREMGDPTGAERSLAQALRIKPGHPLALANLGQIYEETGRSPLAVAAYQKSLTSDWNQPQVASRISRLQGSGTAASTTTVATSIGGVTAGAVAPQVAYLPPEVSQPIPVPAYRQDGLATRPFRPRPSQGLATRPFAPYADAPLASRAFQPNPNLPLAANPFPSSQAFMNIPSGPSAPPVFSPPPVQAYGQDWNRSRVASPLVRQPR